MAITEAGFPDTPGHSPPDLLARTGPSLRVMVGPGDTQSPFPTDLPIGAARLPDHGIESREVLALIDTGARECCIDQNLADQLALPLVDRRAVAGVGGRHSLNVYLATIHIAALGISETGLFTAARLADGGSQHQVILGRSLLRDMILIYDGRRGTVSVCR